MKEIRDMKMTIKLDETEIKHAITEYLEKQGYSICGKLSLNSTPVSQDGPHHSAGYIEAEVEATIPQRKPANEIPLKEFSDTFVNPPNLRTRSEVLKLRENAVAGGCCERFGNQQACDCLTEAIDDLPYRLPKKVTINGDCPFCFGSGWEVHGFAIASKKQKPIRCRRGCDENITLEEYDRRFDNGCSICRDPNCSNPGGQH